MLAHRLWDIINGTELTHISNYTVWRLPAWVHRGLNSTGNYMRLQAPSLGHEAWREAAWAVQSNGIVGIFYAGSGSATQDGQSASTEEDPAYLKGLLALNPAYDVTNAGHVVALHDGSGCVVLTEQGKLLLYTLTTND